MKYSRSRKKLPSHSSGSRVVFPRSALHFGEFWAELPKGLPSTFAGSAQCLKKDVQTD